MENLEVQMSKFLKFNFSLPVILSFFLWCWFGLLVVHVFDNFASAGDVPAHAARDVAVVILSRFNV